MTAPDGRLGPVEAVRLVASREVNIRLRSRAFILTTAITLLLVIGFAILMKLVSGGSDATVGITAGDESLRAGLRASSSAVGESLDITTVADEAAGRAKVADGEFDAMLLADGTRLRVIVEKDLDGGLEEAFNVLAGQLAFNQEISRLGGDPAQVGAAVAQARVEVHSLEPPFPYQPQQLVLGLLAGILIYIALLANGGSVAQGVVEEKSSRVVELLLATIRPWQLMAGKVLGIGLVGLIQVVIIGVGGVTAALAIGSLTISASAAFGTVLWLVVWFLLGFLLYSLAFAALAATVSRQEEVNGVLTPAMMVVVFGYVLGISILPSDPDNRLCEVLSLVPLFSPTLMPMRLAMGGVPAWQAALAVLLALATIPALVWLSGRIYRNAVVRTGARVKLADALRPA